MLLLMGPYQSEKPVLSPRAMVKTEPKMPLLAMSGFVLMSIAHVTSEAHLNHVLNHVLKYKGHTELAPPLTGLGRSGPALSLTPPLKGALTSELGKVGPTPHLRGWGSSSPD